MLFENSLSFARSLDAADPLQSFREKFHIPIIHGKEALYFTGNSLGLQPRGTAACIQQELDDWARLGVEGHFQARHPWMPYHEMFPRQLAPLLGCREEEVVVMNSLTVNLHLLMVSFYRPTPQRYKIICETRAFPSDQYAFESQARFHGFDPDTAVVEATPREGEHTLRTEDVVELIRRHGDSVALVLFGGVNYYTGQYYDLDAITRAAHEVGARAGFDLAHAAGNVELKLHDWQVDFACWCSYKYLNSGPGGVAGAFIHQRHLADPELPRFAGWWGYHKETRFRMEKGFHPIPTAEGWQLSNAPILSMAAHKAALDLFEEAGWDRIQAKRRQLSAYLYFVLETVNKGRPHPVLEIITPADPEARGCQVSLLMHHHGRAVFEALGEAGVIADWREPNVIRVAPVPLYNRFEDIYRLGEIMQAVLDKKG